MVPKSFLSYAVESFAACSIITSLYLLNAIFSVKENKRKSMQIQESLKRIVFIIK
jgi:hypothetical protein